MPNTGKFTQVRRLRLQVVPGTRVQNLDIWDLRTGTLLNQVAIGPGTPHPLGFGLSVAKPLGSALGYSMSVPPAQNPPPQTTGGGSSEAGGSAAETNDPASGGGDGECCDPEIYTDSYGAQSGTEEGEPAEQDSCDPAGEGEGENTTEAPPPGNPPPGNPPPGNQPPPPTGSLFDEMKASIQKMVGGARVEISTGVNRPKIVFDKRDVSINDISADTFRSKFKSADLRPAPPNPPAIGAPGGYEFPLAGVGKGLADANGLRALYTDNQPRHVIIDPAYKNRR